MDGTLRVSSSLGVCSTHHWSLTCVSQWWTVLVANALTHLLWGVVFLCWHLARLLVKALTGIVTTTTVVPLGFFGLLRSFIWGEAGTFLLELLSIYLLLCSPVYVVCALAFWPSVIETARRWLPNTFVILVALVWVLRMLNILVVLLWGRCTLSWLLMHPLGLQFCILSPWRDLYACTLTFNRRLFLTIGSWVRLSITLRWARVTIVYSMLCRSC